MESAGIKLRHVFRADPDVPQDIEEIDEHFNDMNWDFSSQKGSDADSVDMEGKSKSFYASETELDGTSITSSRDIQSRVQFRVQDDLEDDSPYPEVRAAVSNTDDPSMPVNTFRVWLIGFMVAVIVPGINQIFVYRYPSVFIGGLVVQLVSLPIGKFFEKILPTTRYNTFGYIWSFNPGPFNIKEHTVITVIANVTAGGTYAADVVLAQKLFYGQNFGWGYSILLFLSTQFFGFSLAGLTRKFLVWPASMLWPGALVNSALFSTLHRAWGVPDKRHISREKFFFIAFCCSFVWYFFPGYLFTALSIFNWVCWIAPTNVVVNQLFGYSTGLGMGFLTFDWAMISYIGSPLVTPWWAQVNVFSSLVIFLWGLCPILYYTNTWYSKYIPISADALFDNTGNLYDPTQVVSNGIFNQTAYESYSPMFIPLTFTISYGMSFAALAALLSHTWLWYRRDILRLFRASLTDHKDVHARLMTAYKEVPGWWYAVVGVLSFIFGVVAVEAWPTGLPVWAYLFALLIATVYIVPSGIISAITNQTLAVNVLGEFIVGYVVPGRPVATMIFKTYVYFTVAQGSGFTADLKLGHYMKVPPRAMFWAQMLGSFVCVFVQLGIMEGLSTNIQDFCAPDQAQGFVCPSTTTFYNASLIWGAIGPGRLFSIGAMYSSMLWFFLIGILIPIPFYFAAKRWPRSSFRYVNFPVFFNCSNSIPPASGINFSSWIMVGFVFQWFMRRRHFRWWLRYNYILSAALDAGVGCALVFIFFCLQLPKGGLKVNWWGNSVWQNTFDAQGVPFYTLQPGETFGPPAGSWH